MDLSRVDRVMKPSPMCSFIVTGGARFQDLGLIRQRLSSVCSTTLLISEYAVTQVACRCGGYGLQREGSYPLFDQTKGRFTLSPVSSHPRCHDGCNSSSLVCSQL